MDILGANRYEPRELSLTDDPIITWLYVSVDIWLFLTFVGIGLHLLLIAGTPSQRRPTIKGLFASCSILIGTSFLAKLANIFVGVYRLDIFIMFILASLASVMLSIMVSDTWA